MHETLATPLPASWLSSRLGVSASEIDMLRERGELFAVRSDGSGEWLYPAWQFGPGGKIPAGVRAAVKMARSVGLDEAQLVAVLRRRVGLVGGGRLGDLLYDGRPDSVLDAVRAAATA